MNGEEVITGKTWKHIPKKCPIKCLHDIDCKMLEYTDDVVSLCSSLALQTKKNTSLGIYPKSPFWWHYLRNVRRDCLIFIELKGNMFCVFFKDIKILRTLRKRYQAKIVFYHCFLYILFKIKLRIIVKHHSYFFLSSLTVRLLSLLERLFVFSNQL